MALVDSAAAFEQRLNEVIQDAVACTAILLVALDHSAPQSPPMRPFADGVLPAGYNMATYSAFRRLHFEAATLVVPN